MNVYFKRLTQSIENESERETLFCKRQICNYRKYFSCFVIFNNMNIKFFSLLFVCPISTNNHLISYPSNKLHFVFAIGDFLITCIYILYYRFRYRNSLRAKITNDRNLKDSMCVFVSVSSSRRRVAKFLILKENMADRKVK